jgi:maltodextrin utilization protein YvdJ
MNDSNWEQKLKDFETKINRAFNDSTEAPTETVRPHLESESASKFADLVKFVKDWLATLPAAARVMVIILAAIALLSLLNTMLRLLSALMVLAILGIVGYFFFKSFKESRSKSN